MDCRRGRISRPRYPNHYDNAINVQDNLLYHMRDGNFGFCILHSRFDSMDDGNRIAIKHSSNLTSDTDYPIVWL